MFVVSVVWSNSPEELGRFLAEGFQYRDNVLVLKQAVPFTSTKELRAEYIIPFSTTDIITIRRHNDEHIG